MTTLHTTDEQSECGCPSCEHYELVNARNEIQRLKAEMEEFEAGTKELVAELERRGGTVNEESEVWLLWESIYSTTGQRNLLGIYDNEAAAQDDAGGHPRWSVEKWTVDSEAQA